ncbi:MAG: hypothetical protein V4635_15930 [Bacteroidota bacterium]
MIAEWQFNKAVEAFKEILKTNTVAESINSDADINDSYYNLSEYVRTEFKEFAAVPDSQRVILDQLRNYRNSKKEKDDSYVAVNTQRNLIVTLVKKYLDDVGHLLHFKMIAW